MIPLARRSGSSGAAGGCAGAPTRGRDASARRSPGSQIPAAASRRPCSVRTSLRRAHGDRATGAVEGQDDVGERPRRVDAVLDEDDRGRPFRADGCEALEERGRTGRVEIGGRLVEDEQARHRRQDARQREPLLLAARERSGQASPRATEPDGLECHGDPFEHRRSRPGPVLQPERDVILDPVHDDLAGRVLEHQPDPRGERARGERPGLDAVDGQRARPGARQLARDEPGQGQAEGALARARGADDEQAGARRDVQVDTLERGRARAGIGEPEPARSDPDRTGRVDGVCQVGNPSRTPVGRRARTSAIAASGRRTSPEIAIDTAVITSTSVAYPAYQK